MIVDRIDDPSGPSQMTVYFSSQRQGATSAQEADQETTQVINMKNKHSSAILDELLHLVEAREVEPTTEEQQQLDELAEQRRRSDYDRDVMARVIAAKRREQEFLDQAKKSVEAQGSV